MENQKLENLLNISLQATQEEREKSEELGIGYNRMEDTWELIIRYTGEIGILREKYPSIQIRELLNQYAIITLPEALIEAISKETIVNYVEKPKQLYFELAAGKSMSCINTVQQGELNPFELFGEGTITAIIDTGERVIIMSS